MLASCSIIWDSRIQCSWNPKPISGSSPQEEQLLSSFHSVPFSQKIHCQNKLTPRLNLSIKPKPIRHSRDDGFMYHFDKYQINHILVFVGKPRESIIPPVWVHILEYHHSLVIWCHWLGSQSVWFTTHNGLIDPSYPAKSNKITGCNKLSPCSQILG